MGRGKWGEDLREDKKEIEQFSQNLGISHLYPSPCFSYTVFFQTDNSGSFRTNLSSPLEQGKKDVD